MAELPDCNCFKRDAPMGEKLAIEVASAAAIFFIDDAQRQGVCAKAIFHTALTTFVFILDGLAAMEVEADQEKIKQAFQRHLTTISEDLRCRREQMEAAVEREGASLQ